ncbi:MAG: DHH family phosphoesterase [Bacteroidales bacterium]
MPHWDTHIQSLKTILNEAKNVIVVSHINPDGDAVGSSLAWSAYLRKAFSQLSVHTLFPNKFPDFLSWLQGAPEAMIYADNQEQALAVLKSADVIFCLDFNAMHRLEQLGKEVEQCAAKKVLIDHHLYPSEDFTLQFSDTSMSSTSEFVYRIICQLGGKNILNRDIANALYVGLMTDTGSFNFSVNTPETFRMAADLMEFGIDKNEISAKVYDSYSESRMRLMGYCLLEKMQVLPQYKAAYLALSRKELERFNFQSGDTEGLVNLLLSIKGVELAAFFTEALDRTHIRVSLRSKGKTISVNELSRKYFNGGGHFNAAGGKYADSLKNCEQYFEGILKASFANE